MHGPLHSGPEMDIADCGIGVFLNRGVQKISKGTPPSDLRLKDSMVVAMMTVKTRPRRLDAGAITARFHQLNSLGIRAVFVACTFAG